ncbi:MAG: translation initiation factor IF-3 [Alphaproteobacteria bacterium]|nr:translation initiation factor IF-3 [Alphaproteobacteria bacterium]
MTAPPTREGPRVNNDIDVDKVRLVGADGENVGIVGVEEALDMAAEAGMDLVEVSPNADPPVCKILDYGKFKYKAQKKANEARKKQKTVDIKEIKMRPNIDQHDYDVKMRSMTKFIDEGDKVKVTLRFRGREMAHQELGMRVLHRVRDDLQEVSKVEQFPKMEGRQMTMVIAPK